MASFSLSPSVNSITATVSGLSSSHTRTRYFVWYLDGDEVKTTTSSAGSTSHSTTFTGLNPNTKYTIAVDICDTPEFGSALLASFSKSATTEASTGSSITYNWGFTAGYTGANIQIQKANVGDEVRIAIEDSSGNIVYDKTQTATSSNIGFIVLNAFKSNSEYIATIYVNGYEHASFDIVTPSFAMISDLFIDTNSVEFNVYNMESGKVAYANVYNDNYDKELEIEANSNGVASFEFTGLSPDTTYYIYVTYINSDGNETELLDSTFTTDGVYRPSDWKWETIVAKGSKISLTAREWNNFTDRINEFRTYTGLNEYNFTIAISGETQISAYIVNEARNAIVSISGHGTLPSVAISGETALTADFFNDLKNALNAVP